MTKFNSLAKLFANKLVYYDAIRSFNFLIQIRRLSYLSVKQKPSLVSRLRDILAKVRKKVNGGQWVSFCQKTRSFGQSVDLRLDELN